jgi:hypothetical protein
MKARFLRALVPGWIDVVTMNTSGERWCACRMEYDKFATSFVGFVLVGCIRIWARFVHRA